MAGRDFVVDGFYQKVVFRIHRKKTIVLNYSKTWRFLSLVSFYQSITGFPENRPEKKKFF